MALRWTAAGMLEAERQFRRVIGHGDLARLANAVERDRARALAADTLTATPPRCPPRRPLRSLPSETHRAATTKFYGDRDILRKRTRTSSHS